MRDDPLLEAMDEVKAVTERIAPLLRDHGPAIQSVVLAQLLAMWLADNCVLDGDGEEELAARREQWLSDYIELVQRLTMALEARLVERDTLCTEDSK